MAEMTSAAERALDAQIKAAFGDVPAPPQEDVLHALYASSEDAVDMLVDFRGRHWTELPVVDLFRHRQMIFSLSGIGFRAYLPAYLIASLGDDPRYSSEIREFMMFGFMADPDSELEVAAMRDRLSLLDERQRAAVASVLHYLAARWQMAEAEEILHNWK